MRPLGTSIKGVVAAFVISPTGLFGQIPGNIDWPVLPGGTADARVGIDGTQGLNFDSGESLYLGARDVVSQPDYAVSFGGGVAGLTGSEVTMGTGGAGFAYALTNFGQSTLSVDAGFGLAKRSGNWIWGVPAGLTLWINSEGDPTVRPFIRAHGVVIDSGSGTDVGFSAVGGAEFILDSGVGFQVALQWQTVEGNNPLVVGGGVSFGP